MRIVNSSSTEPHNILVRTFSTAAAASAHVITKLINSNFKCSTASHNCTFHLVFKYTSPETQATELVWAVHDFNS